MGEAWERLGKGNGVSHVRRGGQVQVAGVIVESVAGAEALGACRALRPIAVADAVACQALFVFGHDAWAYLISAMALRAVWEIGVGGAIAGSAGVAARAGSADCAASKQSKVMEVWKVAVGGSARFRAMLPLLLLLLLLGKLLLLLEDGVLAWRL